MALLNYIKLLAIMLLIGQCNDAEALLQGREVRFNETFMISAGEDVTVVGEGETLTLRLEEVVDSRCPTDVTCVWAGNAITNFIVGNAGEQNVGLQFCILDCRTGPIRSTHVQKQTIGGHVYEFTLLDVLPYPTTSNHDRTKEAKLIIKPENK